MQLAVQLAGPSQPGTRSSILHGWYGSGQQSNANLALQTFFQLLVVPQLPLKCINGDGAALVNSGIDRARTLIRLRSIAF